MFFKTLTITALLALLLSGCVQQQQAQTTTPAPTIAGSPTPAAPPQQTEKSLQKGLIQGSSRFETLPWGYGARASNGWMVWLVNTSASGQWAYIEVHDSSDVAVARGALYVGQKQQFGEALLVTVNNVTDTYADLTLESFTTTDYQPTVIPPRG
jgi:hypothetical protein